MKDVEACTDVRVFFRDQVAEALRSLDVRTEEPTEHYLVELLSGFAVSERIQDISAPFVEQLAQAMDTTGPERLKRLRGLGDSALFVCGFFSDSCDRRGVTQPYVIAIGARAYGEVGKASRWAQPPAHAAHSQVFQELAERFESFAQVLDEVREQTALCSDGALVRLYERWCSTRSPRLFRRLRRRGVAPTLATPGEDRGPGGTQVN